MTTKRTRMLPFRTLLIAAVALAAAAIPGSFDLLCYDRERVIQGQAWRLVTAHLVHAGSYHLVWDVLPLVALGLLFESVLGARTWRVLAVSSLTVGGGLLIFYPSLQSYCGLSGILNGLWVAGAIVGARRERAEGTRLLASLYLICVIGDLLKIAFESFTGTALFTDASSLRADPVPLAHALGALGGIASLRMNIHGDSRAIGGPEAKDRNRCWARAVEMS